MSTNQRWVLRLTAVASLMVVLDALVVSTALSTIRRDLHASPAQLEWTVNGYALSFAVLLMTAAVLGDRFGFAGAGGYGSRQAFSDGFVAAIATCGGPALTAALAGSALPGGAPRRRLRRQNHRLPQYSTRAAERHAVRAHNRTQEKRRDD
jgi:MFS family permease